MDYLTLVQTLHREAELPGSPPDAVTGQTGRDADLVRWVAEAYNDIQRDKSGRWRWMLGFASSTSFTANTLDYSDFSITRFRKWQIDVENNAILPARIYTTSEGSSDRHIIPFIPWEDFYRKYLMAPPDAALPVELSLYPPDDTIYVGPQPSVAQTLSMYYWKSNQTLVADADEPEMPDDYHMLIVYRALMKYGYNAVGPEILARARTEGGMLYEELVDNQWYAKRTLRWPEALA